MRLVIAKNTLSQLVGRVLSSGSLFVASILIARAFGADGYGDFVKITSYIGLFYLLADFGFNAIYLQKNDDSRDWPTLLGLRLVGSIVLVFISLAILSYLPRGIAQGYTDGVRLGIILFSPAIILQAIITSANAVFQQKLRYELSTVAVAIGSMVTVFLIWLVSLSASPLVGPVASSLAFLAGTLVTAVLGLLLVRTFVSLRLSFDRRLARNLLLGSLPLGLTLIFNQIYFRADSIILTLTRSTVEVGIYGFVYKLFEVALVIPTFFMNSVYPVMVTSEAQDLKRIIKKSLLILGVGSLGVVVLVWVLSPLVSLVRPEFTSGVSALRVLSFSLPFFFLSSVTMWAIISLKHQAILVPIYGVSMAGNIFLNTLFIPSYGFIAAAWITVISEALVMLATGFALKKYL